MNILIDIALEHPDAYCVSPQTVQEAVNRGWSQNDIDRALIEIQIRDEYSDFYIEDFEACVFVANTYKKE